MNSPATEILICETFANTKHINVFLYWMDEVDVFLVQPWSIAYKQRLTLLSIPIRSPVSFPLFSIFISITEPQTWAHLIAYLTVIPTDLSSHYSLIFTILKH